MPGLSLTIPEQMQSSLQGEKHVKYIAAFEGMRGVAALMVFCTHLHAVILQGGLDKQFDPRSMALSKAFGSAGNLGVEVFFLLSGFLVYGSVTRKRFRWPDYLKRRFLRLFPVYLLILSFYILLSILFPSASHLTSNGNPLLYILANALMLPGVFPIVPIITAAWSMSFESCFYLTLPLFVSLPGFRRTSLWRRVLFWIALIAVVVESSGVTVRFTMFIAGVILRSVWETDRFRVAAPRFILEAVCFLWVLISLWFCSTHGTSLAAYLIYCAALFSTGFCALQPGSRLGRFFSLPWFRRVGTISYSFYLIQGITLHGVLMAITKLHLRPVYPVFLSVCSLVTVVAARCLYIYVERPFFLSKPAVNSLSSVPQTE